MLNKLLKYDLKYMIKNMGIFYILGVVFAILSRIISMDSVMLTIIHNITVGCAYAMIANIVINTVIRTWIRFKDSIYKDEAYLTHTLPVTKSQIYNSKFIQALIFYIVSFIVILICLFIMYFSKEFWLQIKIYVDTISTGLNYNPILLVISFLSVVFLEIFNTIQCGFLGIILGFRRSNNKIPNSVGFGFVAYILSQSLVLGLVFVVGLFNSSIMSLFNSPEMLDMNAFKILMILSIILYIIVIGIMYLLCKKALNKGVNVD